MVSHALENSTTAEAESWQFPLAERMEGATRYPVQESAMDTPPCKGTSQTAAAGFPENKPTLAVLGNS